MFTGIVQGTAKVLSIDNKLNLLTKVIEFPSNLLEGLYIGSSISCNGCCLTVSNIQDNYISFEVINETLKTTNLKQINVGDMINIERAAKFNDDINGHIMSGHIIDTTEIIKKKFIKNNWQIYYKLLNKKFKKYIFYKGFIGIDGVSLTVGEVTNNCFCVNIIPETFKNTNLGMKKLGDLVNIEIDFQTQIIVDSVERLWNQKRNTFLSTLEKNIKSNI